MCPSLDYIFCVDFLSGFLFLSALVFKAKTAPACLCACVGVWQVCQGHGNGWQLQLSHRKETRVRSCARRFESKLSKFSSFFPPDFTCSVNKLFNRAGFVRLSLSESMQDEQEEESARAAAQ